MIVRCSSCCHRARPDSRGRRCSHYEAGGWCRRRRRRRLGHSHLWSSSWLPSPPSSSSSMAGSDAVQGGRYRPAPPGSGVDGISFTVHPEYLRDVHSSTNGRDSADGTDSNEPSSRGSRSLGCRLKLQRRRRRYPRETREGSGAPWPA